MSSFSCLPDDMIKKIFEMLDAQVLFKCTFVCRKWQAIIKNSEFIDNYRCSRHRKESLFLLTSIQLGQGPHRYSVDFGNSNPLKPLEGDLQRYNMSHRLNVEGSSYGLVAIYNLTAEELVLWNPAIKKIRRVAYRDEVFFSLRKMRPILLFGFGFEEVFKDYKILCYMEHDKVGGADSTFKLKLYSFSNNFWEDITHHFPTGNAYTIVSDPYKCVLSTENCLNFVMKQLGSGDLFLFGFNLSSRQFKRMSMPKQKGLCSLIRYNKCSVAFVCQASFYSSKYEVWVMGEYGIEESWHQILKISDPLHRVKGLLIPNMTHVLFEHRLNVHGLNVHDVGDDEDVVQIQLHPEAAGIFSCQVESKEVTRLATWTSNCHSYVASFTESLALSSDEA